MLLTGLALRLALRLSLLYLLFLRGVRLDDLGETVRRGLEGDLNRESADIGVRERVRGRPLDGDLEGILEIGCQNGASLIHSGF